MAVELCKVSLWMESMEPGRPLGFLDHRIIRGNGLMGATPKLLEAGVPDDAFKALTGDDRATVSSWKKDNKKHREHGVFTLFGSAGIDHVAPLTTDFAGVESISEDDVMAVQKKATRWFELVASDSFQEAVFAADTWCASFVAPKNEGAIRITDEEFRIARDSPSETRPEVRSTVQDLAGEYAFLHWHLAFPVVVANGGFDLVLGNPPWERVKQSEKEFFSARAPEIAGLSGAKRSAAINALKVESPELWMEFQRSIRQSESVGHFLRASGRFPLCGRGDVNTYAVFSECMRDAVSPVGRVGVIVPTGIATDDTTKFFFADVVNKHQLASLYDFENSAPIFLGVHRSTKFCLLTLTGSLRPTNESRFMFFARQTIDLKDPKRSFTLTPVDLALINPNTKTAPIFRTSRDAELTKGVYQRLPVLIREDDPDGNPWNVFYLRLVHYDDHAEMLQASPEGDESKAVYESKMMHQFNHRWADWRESRIPVGQESATDLTESELADKSYFSRPRYWMNEKQFQTIISKYEYSLNWLLGYRDITNVTNERTVIAAAVPIGPASVNMPVLGVRSVVAGVTLLASFNSFVLDFIGRQAVGGSHLTFGIVKQLPILKPETVSQSAPWSSEMLYEWLKIRVLELSYTALDLRGFGEDLGYVGEPFIWDTTRRELIRAELDAAFFYLYGIERNDADYILETFPIVKRKDEAKYGEYRTKRLILERYDAIAQAASTGTEYQTVLQPPPADPACAHQM
jgi:hypothetical protein